MDKKNLFENWANLMIEEIIKAGAEKAKSEEREKRGNNCKKKNVSNNSSKSSWVKEMTKNFYHDESKNPNTVGVIGIDNTIIVVYGNSIENPKIGIAKCNPTDNYDIELGIAIAYARATDKTIPNWVYSDDEELTFDEVKIGDMFIKNYDIYLKVDKNKAYNTKKKKLEVLYTTTPIDEIVK